MGVGDGRVDATLQTMTQGACASMANSMESPVAVLSEP